MGGRTESPSPCRFRRLGELGHDEGGNVLIYVAISAAVMMGMVGLALDGSRAMITHSEAQAAADAAALAGASQLDGQSGACARAKTEAAQVANRQRFASSGPGNVAIASGSPSCLSGLPSSDAASTGSYVTLSDTAPFVQVTTQQLTHQNSLLNAVSSDQTALVQRTAVAGFHRTLCAASPVMMVCSSVNWLAQAGIVFDAWSTYGGNKGFLAPGCNSANCVEATLATTTPAFCVPDGEEVDPGPGNKTNKAQDGVNTRFGIGSTATRPSDTNVTSYPLDKVTGTLGWDCSAYWSTNHASDGFAKPAACTSNATSLRRYDVYQSERAAGKIPVAGRPSAGTPTTTAERRLMYLAVLNCAAGSNKPTAYVKAFMITPAVGTSSKTLYVEVISLATAKTDPTAVHEEVQLYR